MTAVDPNLPILVVDQYQTMRRVICRLLAEIGFTNVEKARGARGALRRLRARPYALVICDWKMVPVDGLELLGEVRADPRFEGLPFLLLTAGCAQESTVLAKRAGASACLVKPFDAGSLEATLVALLAGGTSREADQAVPPAGRNQAPTGAWSKDQPG